MVVVTELLRRYLRMVGVAEVAGVLVGVSSAMGERNDVVDDIGQGDTSHRPAHLA